MAEDFPNTSDTNSSADADESRLIDFLADHDCDCPLCHYNLRGLTSAHCPECGQHVKLTVGLADLLMWPWACMAVASCLCAGLGLMCVFMLALQGLPPATDSNVVTWIRDVSIYGFIAAIPIAIAVIIKRRSILRLNPARQKRIAWTCITLFAAFFITMAITFQ